MRDEGAHSTWHKIGHAELWLGSKGVSVRRDLAQDMPMSARGRSKSVENVDLIKVPLVLHGVVVGAIKFKVQIRKINALDGDNEQLKSEILRQKDMARRQSYLSMRNSGKHSANDFSHLKSERTRSSDIMLNPKDSYEKCYMSFKYWNTQTNVHDTHEMEETDKSLLKAEHIHNKHVANQKIAVAGTHVAQEINDKGTVETDVFPPAPSFSESDHRMSAMLFHAPPPPVELEASDEIERLPIKIFHLLQRRR